MKKTLLTSVAVIGLTLMAGTAHAGKGGKHFDKMDTNGDGEISKQEFVTNHEKHFEKMDANNDGKVTKAELKAHRKDRKKGHKKDHKHDD